MKVKNISLLAMLLMFYVASRGNPHKIDPTNTYFKEDTNKDAVFNNGYRDMNELFYPKIQNGQAYLYSRKSGTVTFGPCRYIYYDDLNNKVFRFRFVDQNGLIGYASIKQDETISILLNGQYTEATAMQNEGACVKDENFYYFIDKNGIRFSEHNYVEASPFENQGFYSRIKKDDGLYAIIDKNENIILDSFQSIEPLPLFTTFGAGKRDGKVVLFSLEQFEDDSESRITSILNYNDIHMLGRDSRYAIVTNEKGKKGVILVWNGEVFIPAEYVDIQFGNIDNIDNTFFFRCQKEDATVDYFYTKGAW